MMRHPLRGDVRGVPSLSIPSLALRRIPQCGCKRRSRYEHGGHGDQGSLRPLLPMAPFRRDCNRPIARWSAREPVLFAYH